jgi:serine/threonine-protein kinase
LEAGLAGHYTIERELGRGGMATVYLAQDVRHDRPVALKVLHPDLAHSLGPERFQREIRLAARLQHPHILTVHDSGEAAGQLWFTMPYVEGESLRQRLARDKQLPVDEAVRIAREAAQALEYAHQHGVIHRDVKPENLLLTQDGNTLVADFGIARTLAGGGERLTETGLAIGTPAYMSPEQASGEHDVGPRSDVYSLGAVLFEMLTGEAPFTGATPQAVIAKRFTGEVPSVRKTRPNAPESLDQVIGRSLALVPADRFGTAADFGRALAPAATQPTAVTTPVAMPAVPAAPPRSRRRVPATAITLVLGFAIGLGVLFAWRRDHGGDAPSGVRRLAVLPFENQGAASDDYFADGLTEEVRGKLTALPGMQVTASTSSGQYRKSTKTLKQIAAELGVDYVLVGKVRWEKRPDGTSRVRVSPELIDVRSGASKWQEPFDAALTDIFQVQSEIASQVAGKLDVALSDSAKTQLEAKPTQNVAAYDAYLRGLGAATDPAALRANIGTLEQAVALDPSFARAWAELSTKYSLLYANSVPTRELAQQARRAADRAVALAPSDPGGLRAVATYYRLVDVKPDSARGAIEAAARLAPGDPQSLTTQAAVEMQSGQWDSALVLVDAALARDPRSARSWRGKSDVLDRLHRYPEARAAADRGLQLEPGTLVMVQARAFPELMAGDLRAAQAVLRRSTASPAEVAVFMSIYNDLYWVLPEADQNVVLRLGPSSFGGDRSAWASVLAEIYAMRGDSARMRSYADSGRIALEEQLHDVPNDPQRHVFLGLMLAYLGRKAEAIAEGERGAALLPMTVDVLNGLYNRRQLMRIYIATGEQEKALDVLERLLKAGDMLSPAWLRIDPTFAPLRGNARFQRLAAGS